MITTIFAFLVFYLTIAVSLVRPWIGIVAGYLLAIWVPVAIWPWVFRGVRVVFYVSASTIVGFIVAALSGKVNFSVLKSYQNLLLLILWILLIISYFFNPIEVRPTIYQLERGLDPGYLIQNVSKVIFFYFIGILLIDTKRKLHFLVWVILFSAVYLIYWGNMEYFSGSMRGLHYTLLGPGYQYVVSVYYDENVFAMFFVTAIPFLYFMGRYYQNKFLKGLLWLCIPFAWHCIFLTGSRGGLVGVSFVTLYIMFRSRSKIISLAIPVLLVLAFLFQSGDYIKMRGASALNVEQDSSAQNRFDSWKTGLKMMADNPVTGVGIGNFLGAYSRYSETRPYVAHNTVVQLGAESGMGAALMYLLLCFGIFRDFIKNRKKEAVAIDPFYLAVKESLIGSLVGFFVCSIFLNLATYEIFYYLLALNVIRNRLAGQVTENIKSEKTQPVMR